MTTGKWQILRAAGTNIDITEAVIAHDVRYGAIYHPEAGHWSPTTARGALQLDATNSLFNQPNLGLTEDEFSSPLVVNYYDPKSPAVAIWRGLAYANAANALNMRDNVTWRLVGRYRIVWGTSYPYRHVSFNDQTATYPTPLAFARAMVDGAGQDAGYGFLPGPNLFFPASQQLTDPNSVGPPFQWIYPRVAGTVAQNWRDIGRFAGCVTYEDHLGRLGMKTIPAVLGDIPSGRVEGFGGAFQEGSALAAFPPLAAWGIDLRGSSGQVTTPTATPLATVMVTLNQRIDPNDASSGFFGEAMIEYPFRQGIADVTWTKNPTPPTGADSVEVTVRPLVQRNADLVRVRVTAATQPSAALTVSLTGSEITSRNVQEVPIRLAGATTVAKLPDPGWLNFASTPPPDTTVWTSYIQAINRIQDRFELSYPLFDAAGNRLVPHDHMRPGTIGTYLLRSPNSNANRRQGMCQEVRLRGRRGQLDRVSITGTTLTGRIATTVVPGPPPPAPPEMYPGTPQRSTDPHGGMGDTGHFRFKGIPFEPVRVGNRLINYRWNMYDAIGNNLGVFFMRRQPPTASEVEPDWDLEALQPMTSFGAMFWLRVTGNPQQRMRLFAREAYTITITVGSQVLEQKVRITAQSLTQGIPVPGISQRLTARPDDDPTFTAGSQADLIKLLEDSPPPVEIVGEWTLPDELALIDVDQTLVPEYEVPAMAQRDNTAYDLGTVNITKWNGRAQAGRGVNPYMICHTAENGGKFAAGTRTAVLRYLQGVQRYAGYHIIVDLGGYTIMADPRNTRAYHAIAGNDGVGVSFAGRTSDWADLLPSQRRTLWAHAKDALAMVGQNRTNWTRSTTTSTMNGVIDHGAIQDDRTDPGWSEAIAAEFIAAINAS